MPAWTQLALREALPQLLEERGISLRALARSIGVSDAHLSRVVRGQKRPTGHLSMRIATALNLDPDYFPEAREEFVLDRVRNDPALRDELYRRLGPR